MNLPAKMPDENLPALKYSPVQYLPGMRIEQGIYLGMPEDVYFGTPAISVSGLKKFRKAPALYKFGEHETTPAQSIGKLWHTALLEPGELEKRFMPTDVERRGTKAWAMEEQFAAGRELIKRDDWEEMQIMCASIFGQGGALVDVLTHQDLQCEMSFFWWDHPAGVFCRARADIAMINYKLLGDIKSCQDADEDFKFAVRDWLYHWQAAFYKRGLRTLGYPIDDFVFFAIEKQRPYLCAPWVMPGAAVDDAERKILTELLRYRECLDANFWPGLPDEIRLVDYPESWLNYE